MFDISRLDIYNKAFDKFVNYAGKQIKKNKCDMVNSIPFNKAVDKVWQVMPSREKFYFDAAKNDMTREFFFRACDYMSIEEMFYAAFLLKDEETVQILCNTLISFLHKYPSNPFSSENDEYDYSNILERILQLIPCRYTQFAGISWPGAVILDNQMRKIILHVLDQCVPEINNELEKEKLIGLEYIIDKDPRKRDILYNWSQKIIDECPNIPSSDRINIRLGDAIITLWVNGDYEMAEEIAELYKPYNEDRVNTLMPFLKGIGGSEGYEEYASVNLQSDD